MQTTETKSTLEKNNRRYLLKIKWAMAHANINTAKNAKETINM